MSDIENIQGLQMVAKKMVAPDGGILAADESNGTAGKRLRGVGIENSEENRRRYRQLFLGATGIEEYLNGVILFTETMQQNTDDGILFPHYLLERGIIPGVKLDLGTVPLPGFPGEEVTEGLDGLPNRAGRYVAMGAKFAKWRTVTHVGDEIPTQEATDAIGYIQARYARVCQEQGLVPIVEPEVLLKGDHSIERAEEVTTNVLKTVFKQCRKYHVDLSAVILKSSMVVPGEDHDKQAEAKEVAQATARTLKAAVPKEVPGVVFLSGGQEPEEATANLNAIAKLEPLPWEIAFSYARALQQPALDAWEGEDENVEQAREVFLERLRLNVEADQGEYSRDME